VLLPQLCTTIGERPVLRQDKWLVWKHNDRTCSSLEDVCLACMFIMLDAFLKACQGASCAQIMESSSSKTFCLLLCNEDLVVVYIPGVSVF
jgi:hypothetical protein